MHRDMVLEVRLATGDKILVMGGMDGVVESLLETDFSDALLIKKQVSEKEEGIVTSFMGSSTRTGREDSCH